MFGSIGGPELIVIFVVALLIFGPRKLPELGRMLGKGLSEFRRAAADLKDSLEVEVAREESSARPSRREGGTTVAAGALPQGSASGAGAADPAPEAVAGGALSEGTTGVPDERRPEEPT
jgi:sec-independent protein translocase protein TatA